VKLNDIWGLLRDTFTAWGEDKAARLAAALSYYAIFSLAPLLIVLITIAGIFLGQQAAQNQIVIHIQGVVGKNGAEFIQNMIKNARNTNAGILASAIGIVTLLLGATGLFGQLQNTLNAIWDVPQQEGAGIMGIVKQRFMAFAMLLGIGLIFLFTLGLDAAVLTISKFAGGLFPGISILWQIVNIIVSFAIITFAFALIFKVVPDAEIDWHDVWLGAVVTALLFTLGKYLIGIYLSNAGVGSTYGAAGSLVVLLLWIYYSAQIFFFGAEFTQVYANRFGSKIVHGNQVLMEELDIRKQVENSGRTGSRQTVNGEKEAMVSGHDKLAISHREQELEPLPQMQPSLLAFSTLLATLVGFLAGLLFFRGTSPES
jgi:membrane protein